MTLPIGIDVTLGTRFWPGRPFPGFFVLENGIVPSVGLYEWTGLRARVPFHARVLTVDGQPVRTNADVYDRVARVPVGTPVAYTLEKDGHRIDVSVPTMRFGAIDYWLTVGLFLVNGLVCLVGGSVVSLLQPRAQATRAFLVLSFFNALFAFTAAAIYLPNPGWLSALHLLAQATFPATYIHFGLVVPVARPILRRRPALLSLPYLVSAGLTLWAWHGYYASPPQVLPLHAAYIYSALAIALVGWLLAYAYWTDRTPLVRGRVLVIFLGWVLGLGLSFVGFVSAADAGGDFPMNLIALTGVVCYIAVAYAIGKHDLFDIDAVLKRTLLYATLTLGITGAYAGALVLLGLLFPEHLVRASPVFNVAFVVLVAFLFAPLRAGVQRILDRVFHRSRPDYRRTVSEVSAALTSLLDLDEILGRVGRTVTDGLQLHDLAVLLWLDDATTLWRYRKGTQRMEESTGPPYEATRRQLGRSPRQAWALSDLDPPRPDDVDASHEMHTLGAVLLLPLTIGDRVLGAFALGPKRSGLAFSREDLELLGTLAAQSAVAIQNALSYRSLEGLNAELEAKVHARTAELEASNVELGRAYQDLKATQAQLLQTEKMASLGQLVAGVAHEINNPVSFIVGNIDPLRRRLETLRTLAAQHADTRLATTIDRIDRSFDIIARGAERTAGIVNDLRTFSRVGESMPRPTDLHEGIEIGLRLLQPRLTDRVRVHRDYGAVPPVEVAGGQLNQVFMNVLANACDAIDGPGNIWIHTACDGDRVTITIRDDGCGISTEHTGRIFDPFFTTKAPGKGTGLGLAISHGIVTNHGGTIRVGSAPGRGTEFTIALPLRRTAVAS